MTREELYRKFGPKLIDAVVQLTLEQINVLRVKAGLPEITGQQLIDAISNRLDSIPDYDWMNVIL